MENESQGNPYLDLSKEELESRLLELQNRKTSNTGNETVVNETAGNEASTDVQNVDEPKELNRLQKIFGVGNGLGGSLFLDYSGGHFIHGAGKGPVEYYTTDFKESISAPGQGLIDTGTDAINLATPRGIPDIPKVKTYENNAAQVLRNISGLVIPSLGLRSMMLNVGTKYHAAGTAAPWLQRIGNKSSFQWFARAGIDIFSGGLVDYVAEQNQKDDNLFGTLKKYWPQTFQWIPNSIATTDDDSPGEKRAKNINEGAVFSVFSSIVEGIAYLTRAGKSINKTSKFVSTADVNKSLNTTDEFSNIKFSNIPAEDATLRQYARQNKELELLNRYYANNDLPTINWDLFDETEKLVRTKDPDGILGAFADEAQIQNNIETGWGRIGNLVNEAFRKEGIELENLHNRTLVSQLTQEIKEGGSFYKKLKSGTVITDKAIKNASKKLAATLLHPRVEPDEIIGLLDEFKKSVDESAVRIIGKKSISRAIKQLQQQMLDLDAHKARAFLATSEAGQIADMSEGARLMEDSVAVNRSIDLMADRLEVLQVEKALANFEANSMYSHMNAWKQAVDTGDKEIINQAAETILANTDSRLTEIIPKVKGWTQTLKTVSKENPAFLKPLLLANEMTDGNVDSLYKLHDWAANNLGVFKKAIYDGSPEMPSIINKAMWSNLFNSALSAFSTPAKAAMGNLTGILGKGAATVTGAVASGDLARAKKAMVAHFALDDTLTKAFDHLRLVFRKASNNPKEVSYVMRSDIAREAERGLDALRAWSGAAAENGEYGGQMMIKLYEDLDALSVDPVLRFGGNSMSALDGFTRSVMANTEAKYIALNKLAQSGEEITDKSFKAAYREIYDSWFDENGMINNKAVEVATSEIALNADSPIVDAMNEFIKRFPAARSFIWFPRTTANVIDTFGKWSPAGIFSKDYHDMWGPFGRKSINDFTKEEIASILTRKGKPVDEFALETFNMLRYETKGKAALGSLMVAMAGMSVINGRCTGTGHYDKSRQRLRLRSGWKAKTCSSPDSDKAVSYEWMGPIGDWVALTADVVDNFDSLSSGQQEDIFNKLAFILSSAITNRSMLSQLEPLHDVLSGNGAALSRWSSSFLNNLVPLGSLRNELGKIMYPQLRELRAEFDLNLRNRNAWLDSVDPSRALADKVDPIDGKSINAEDNWFLRVFNRGPIKVHSKPSKESQFLIDIEFNSSPNMNLSSDGAPLEYHEIEAINTQMGKDGFYKQEINTIMKDANKLTYTAPDGTVYKGFVNIIRAQRRGWITSEILETDKFANIYTRIQNAYSRAKSFAEAQLPPEMKAIIDERVYEMNRSKTNHGYGDLNAVLEDAGLQETLNMAK